MTVAAVVDIDIGAAAHAQAHNAPFYRDSLPLRGRIDAAIIATPAAEHVGCALPLLAAGIHCLVEKPLATTEDDCALLVATAARHAATLAVGHSERFNPGVGHARRALAIGTDVRRIEAFRVAPSSDTGPPDADVVQDLMVHDLDWVIDGIGQLPRGFTVRDVQRRRGVLSHVSCELAFADGRQIALTASRMETQRRRSIHLHLPRGGMQVIDLDAVRSPAEEDPLTRQAHAFLEAVSGRPSGIATGKDVLPVMSLSDRIRARCGVPDAPAS